MFPNPWLSALISAVGASLAGALGWMARKSVTAQSSQQPFVSFYFTA